MARSEKAPRAAVPSSFDKHFSDDFDTDTTPRGDGRGKH